MLDLPHEFVDWLATDVEEEEYIRRYHLLLRVAHGEVVSEGEALTVPEIGQGLEALARALPVPNTERETRDWVHRLHAMTEEVRRQRVADASPVGCQIARYTKLFGDFWRAFAGEDINFVSELPISSEAPPDGFNLPLFRPPVAVKPETLWERTMRMCFPATHSLVVPPDFSKIATAYPA